MYVSLKFPAGCDPLEDPENGRVTVSGLAPGDVASYECNPGFERVGVMQRTCNGVLWSDDPPVCRGIQ